MDSRTFPVLTDEEQELVDRFSTGVGEHAGRVLAYLVRRLEDDSLDRTATLTAVHIGTGLSKNAARTSLDRLAQRDLIERTTVETSSPGRPPTAWHAVDPVRETRRHAYDEHARRLLEQGARFDDSTAPRAETESATAPSPTATSSDSQHPDRRREFTAGATEERERDSERPGDATPITVGLNWHPNGFHVPLFASVSDGCDDRDDRDNGDYRDDRDVRDDRDGHDDHRLSIEFSEYTGSSDAARAVASGAVDVAVAGAATVLRERAAGLAIVPVAVLFQRSPVVLYTTRAAVDEPFTTIDQLRGRRVGMPPDSETGVLGRLLLSQAGVRDAVELVELAGEERVALQSGTVDVVTGMAPDARRLERAGHEVDTVSIADQYPAYGPALVASRDAVESNRAALVSVLAAVMDGWARATASPAAAAARIAPRSSESDAPARIERTFRLARDRFGDSDAVRKHGWGWHSPDDWHNLQAALSQGDVLVPE